MDVTAISPMSPAAEMPKGSDAPHQAGASGKDLPPAGKKPPVEKPAPPPVSIEKALAQIKAYLSDSRRQLTFQFDESSGRTIITVVNPASGEVIRRIPSEEVIQVAAMLDSQGLRTIDDLA